MKSAVKKVSILYFQLTEICLVCVFLFDGLFLIFFPFEWHIFIEIYSRGDFLPFQKTIIFSKNNKY